MASRPISHSPGLVAGIIFVMSSSPTCGAAVAPPGSLLKIAWHRRDRLLLADHLSTDSAPIRAWDQVQLSFHWLVMVFHAIVSVWLGIREVVLAPPCTITLRRNSYHCDKRTTFIVLFDIYIAKSVTQTKLKLLCLIFVYVRST